MMTTQLDLAAIQQAIRQLTRRQREELAEWILNSGDFGGHLAEPELPWGQLEGAPLLTLDEYLRLESEGPLRHEYVAGAVFALAGPVVRHEVIVANLLAHFHAQLRGGPCKVFSSNARVRIRQQQNDILYLPDLAVACGPFSDETLDLRYLDNPAVVIEVSSPATESIDRREKALMYRCVPSLEEYVLIAQRSLNVTIYRRDEDWIPKVLTMPQDVVELRAVDVNLTLAEVYEGTR